MDKPTTRGNILRKTTLAIALVSGYGYMPISAAVDLVIENEQNLGGSSMSNSTVTVNDGGVATGDGTKISGRATDVVLINAGGSLTLSNATLSNDVAPNTNGRTITAKGANATASLTDSTIVISAHSPGADYNHSFTAGVGATDGGHVDIRGGSITASGSKRTVGMQANDGGSISASGVTITTENHFGHGVQAYRTPKENETPTHIELDKVSITTNGDNYSLGIQSANKGASVTATDTTIKTVGTASAGVEVFNGATATLNNGSITTGGDAAAGVRVYGGDLGAGSATINGTTIETGGLHASGVLAGDSAESTSGIVNITKAHITTTGDSAAGLESAYGSSIGSTASILHTEGASSHGVYVHDGGSVSLNGDSVTTDGFKSFGLYATGTGSTISAIDTVVLTKGEQAVAAHAAAGGRLVIENATLTNENAGIKSHGVVVEGAGSTAELTESHIIINGSSASHGTGMPFGIFAHDNGEVTMTGGSIQAQGEKYNRGIYASTGGTVNAEGVAISTSGTNSHAVHALGKDGENTPTINVKGGTVSTAEDESYGLYAQDGGKITSSADIVTKGDAGFGVYGWNGDIELTGGSVTTSGGVFTKTDGGTTGTHGVLAMKGSTITLDGTSVTTTGERADGFRAETSTTGASIIGTNVDIDTSGKGAHGVSVIGQGSSVTMNGGSITTRGEDSSGAFLEGGSSITLNNVKVEAAGASITSNLTGAGQEQTITIGSGSELMKNNGTLWSVMRAENADGTAILDLQGGSVVWGNVIENGGAVSDVAMTKVILDPDAVWAGVIVDEDTEVVAEGDSQSFDNSPIGQLVTGTGSSATFTNGANIADSVSAGIASNVTFNGDTSIGADVNAMPASRLAFNGPTAIGGSVVAVNGAQLGFNGPSTSIAGGVTLTGAGTAVHGGTIAAPIEIAGDARVDSGAILGGNLNVAGELSGNGGVLSPGNSMGKQTYGSVAGFTGDYHAEINAAGASDQVTIGSGNFDLTGINLFVAEENGNAGYRLNHDYTIVKTEKADGISSVTDNKFANDGQLVGSLSQSLVKLDPVAYGDNDVRVSLSLDEEKVTAARSGLSKNQNATLDGVSSVLGRNAAADAAVTSADFKGALNQLSGEVHASTQTALLNSSDLLVRTLSNRMRGNVGSGMIAGAPTAQSSGAVAGSMPTSAAYPLWAEVVGSWSKLDGNGNAADAKTRIGGLFIGGDTAVGNGWRVGGALGFTDGRVEVDDRSSKSDIKGYTAALYGGNSWATSNGNINLLGGAAYTYHEIDSRRTVNVGGSQTLEADYKANTTQLFAELGYAFPVGQASTVEPYLGVAWLNQRAKGFSETGGAAALQGDSQHDDVTTTTLGLRGTTMLDMGEKQALLKAGLGWRHAAGDIETSRRMSFAQSNGAQFKVAGAPIAKNAAVVDLGAEVSIGKATSLGLSYSGQFGDGNTDNAGSLYLKVRFN